MEIKLTQFSHGSGCGCKVAPAVLDEILKPIGDKLPFPKELLVGSETKDDAAVYDLGNGTALISTVDFFTPIVNNPFNYGKIAAANALSDVYAMGGKPLLAIAVMGLPVEKLNAEVAQQIIAGGKEVCSWAGIPLAGGHTIDAPEPFFGLAVNGMVNIKQIKRNSTAKAGDIIYLTKPIGSGILATALKRELIAEDEIEHAVHYMCMLNTFGNVIGHAPYLHALTDVTGFGLLGHLIEMCEGAGLSAKIDYASVPLMERVKEFTEKFIYADNTMRNWKAYENKTAGISGESLLTLCDPQTSGGLLMAIDPEQAAAFEVLALKQANPAFKIGKFTERREKLVEVV